MFWFTYIGRKKMIIVRLKGGLGNQMFQYACGRALSEKNKRTLLLDLTSLLHRPSNPSSTVRNYELDVFNIQERFTFLSRLNKKISNSNLFYKINSKLDILKDQLEIVKKINDKEMGFDEQFFKIKGKIYLDGYWQSEKYFKDIEDIIRKEFILKSMGEEANKIKKVIEKEKNSVSIHIRRGDYVNNPKTLAIHGVCSIDYYKRAIKYINKKTKGVKFFVFSDDIPWVKENLELKNVFFVSNSNIKAEEDLFLMSLCKNNIIANSSFSWWGAWLNKNREKIVVAPQNWFNNKKEKDIVPLSWIRI